MEMANAAAGVNGSAISTLMQQLKNGEISRMQLFQQIAKLNAAAASGSEGSTSCGATDAAAVMPAAVMPFPSHVAMASRIDDMGKASMATPYVSLQRSPRGSPSSQTMMLVPSKSPASVFTSAPTSIAQQASATTQSGPRSMENDPDMLVAGVSHEKAQRLSVQEWMAKTRGVVAAPPPPPPIVGQQALPPPITTPTANGVKQGSPQMQVPSDSLFLQQQQALFGSLFTHTPPPPEPPVGIQSSPYGDQPSDPMAESSTPPAASPSIDQQTSDPMYVYAPKWQLAQSSPVEDQHDPALGNHDDPGAANQEPHEYLEFDRFAEEQARNAHSANGNKSKGMLSSSDDAASFHARVIRWKSQKDAIREQMKQQLLQSELDECTFTPKVNPKSTKVVAKLRGRQRSEGDVHVGQSVSERLYQEADTYKQREELAAQLRAEEDEELRRECTFKPKINKATPITSRVRAKYKDSGSKDLSNTPAAMEAAAKELEECTFFPQVNPILPEMVSAQLYLQQDIFDRLSRPCIVPCDTSSLGGGGTSSELGSVTTDAASISTPRSQRSCSQDDIYVRSLHPRNTSAAAYSPVRRTSRPRPRSAGGGGMDDENTAEHSKRFAEFLERQQFHEQARKKRIEMAQQQLRPAHKPQLNRASVQMMENGRKGDFLERITKYALRREQDTVQKKTARVADPNCTFRPTINTISAKRKPRSVTELSRGDLLRRETAQRLMKLRMEQAEMSSLTFQPHLNRISQRIEGKLKILTSPDTYLQRIQQQSQASTVKHRRAIQEKEMEEFAECTFKPHTIDAPAYVQRMAKSVAVTRALKKQEEAMKAHGKPEWK